MTTDNLIDNSFNYCDKDFIRVSYNKAWFSQSDKKTSGHYIFTKDQVIKLLNFIVDNSYIKYKGKIYRQFVGIPMGIDPAPFMANLFLHYYENKFIKNLVDNGNIKEAGVLKYTFRYLDDLLSINDAYYFKEVISSIYPSELKLSSTNINPCYSEFLDLDISIVNGKLHSKIFDKRRNFNFNVINFPDIKFSNVPSKPSYGIFYSQLIRILRICNHIEYFCNEVEILSRTFLGKGFSKVELCAIFDRFILNYKQEWGKFGADITTPDILL